MENERRQYRRLSIRLPLECYPADSGREHALRTVTTNIGTGGLYFEIDPIEGAHIPEPQSVLNIELTVPPGDGHFPYQGRVTSVAEVVRRHVTGGTADTPGGASSDRVGLAVKFREPLKLAF